MTAPTYLLLAFFAALPVWSQVTVGGIDPRAGTAMKTPPPVSGQAYPVEVGAETRMNYLTTGVTINSAYNDNVQPGVGSKPIGDASYTIAPTISLNHSTERLHQMLTYSPGFTFYQHTTSLNAADQGLLADVEYRLTPHITISGQDALRKTTNVFNQLYGGSSLVSGSPQSSLSPVVAPIADQLSNTASIGMTYQFARNDMIGASGMFGRLDYLNSAQSQGLFDSTSRGASTFYSHRVSTTQYIGTSYQYSDTLGIPNKGNSQPQSETMTHSVLAFYTNYLTPALSVSLTVGPQHFDVSQPGTVSQRSWAPFVGVSGNFHSRRVSSAVSYLQDVSGGGGLIGAYNAKSVIALLQAQVSRNWVLGLATNYIKTANVGGVLAQANPGGQTVSGTLSMQHYVGPHFVLEAGYTRLNQQYDYIAAVSSAPNANREYISISYQFTRPLGR